MAEERSRSIAEIFADHELVEGAINRAVRAAIIDHARAGRSVPVSQNGSVVWLAPAEILKRYGEEPADA